MCSGWGICSITEEALTAGDLLPFCREYLPGAPVRGEFEATTSLPLQIRKSFPFGQMNAMLVSYCVSKFAIEGPSRSCIFLRHEILWVLHTTVWVAAISVAIRARIEDK